MDKDIQVNKVQDHYEIYVDGSFHCSCDNWTEVNRELKKLN